MANIRKTFNFRNGVQVDEDNLIVNPNGLVGIGTSVPTEVLDVRGTAKVVGLVTATEVFAQTIRTSGISTLGGNLEVGIVSVTTSGIITATSLAGVVTYYGDGGRLLNLPTSQWLDVDIGLGFTSIYAQGYVGVNTISPIYPFQVAGTDSTREFGTIGVTGVGIDSTGNIYSTGIVTAKEYLGVGYGLTSLNASNIIHGTLDNARLPSDINISGIITSQRVSTGALSVSNGLNISAGILTALGGIQGTLTGDITGDVTGTASTARSLTGTPDIVVGIVTATNINSNISTTGISTVTNRLFVENNIGVNTVAPAADVHIVKNSSAGVLVTAPQDGYVAIGNTLARGQLGGEIRFGNLSGSFSGAHALDLVNYDVGDINQYIHQGAAGINTGDFNWIYGQDQTARMTLTWDGKLGIAKTTPDHELHVVGFATITEDLFIGDDLFVVGDTDLGGDLTVDGVFTTNTLNVLGGINANLNNTSGLSTFFNVDITNFAEINTLGIGTDTTLFNFQLGTADDLTNDLGIVANTTFLGIGSETIYPNVDINAVGKRAIIEAVGVGTTRPKSAVDFRDAGRGYSSDAYRFMMVPAVSTSERNALDTVTDNIGGAIVYNTSITAPEYYNGTSWKTLGEIGITTYANVAGVATDAVNVVGGIVSAFSVSTGIATVSELKVGTEVTINSGIVTASNGFTSGIGGPVEISVSGSVLTFNVPGVGSTSLTLS